jgi:hypothetical protein
MTTKKSTAQKASKRKYSKSAGKSVETEMKARKEGKLRSGKSGKKVTSKKQAICYRALQSSQGGQEGAEEEMRHPALADQASYSAIGMSRALSKTSQTQTARGQASAGTGS